MDVKNNDEVISQMRSVVASKQFGQEDILCHLITDTCIQVCPKNPANFNVDNVRVAKLQGGGLHNCAIVRAWLYVNGCIRNGLAQQPETLQCTVKGLAQEPGIRPNHHQ